MNRGNHMRTVVDEMQPYNNNRTNEMRKCQWNIFS